MSLLDDDLDIDLNIFEHIIKEFVLTILNDSFEIREVIFEECCWKYIVKEPHKYYVYIKVWRGVLYIHIGKIHESLCGQKYGVDSPYTLVRFFNKRLNLKQILNL